MQEMGRYALIAIGVIALVAVVYAFLKWSQIPIPDIAIWIFWILIGAVVCAAAVKLIMRMMQSG